jgi:hypothetical protein
MCTGLKGLDWSIRFMTRSYRRHLAEARSPP